MKSKKGDTSMSEQIEYAEVTHVRPGIVIDLLREKVVLTLTRITNEPLEVYVERCNEIVNYAISKSPHLEPPVFDFSDTTKYRQVGPDSWESVTPGYQPQEDQEEATGERDTHFQEAAAVLWDKLHTLYHADTAHETDADHEATRARYEHMDKRLIAQFLYDLVHE